MEKRYYTVYKFDELSEEAQEQAVENLGDINVDCAWWEPTLDGLENMEFTQLAEDYPYVNSVTVKGFDVDRGNYADIDVDFDDRKLFEHVFKAHPHKNMLLSLFENGYIYESYRNGEFVISHQNINSRIQGLIDGMIDKPEVIKEIEGEVISLLRAEYEYMTSEEEIIETIRCNECNFTEDGNPLKIQEM